MKEKRTSYHSGEHQTKNPTKKIALILAGGGGERFWPLSRNAFPKQFLKLYGENSPLRDSFLRLRSFLPLESIFIVLGKELVHLVEAEIPELPRENFIIEPLRRDTLGAISLSCLTIEAMYPNASIFICPADHRITNQKVFSETVEYAYQINQKHSQIITFGIPPTRPDTAFGYIQLAKPSQPGINQVQAFVEKPSLEKAQNYSQSSYFLWNSGMFLWKIQDFWTELKKVSPQIYQEIMNLKSVLPSDYSLKNTFEKKLIDCFASITKTSIDYALLEKTQNILCLKGDFDWDDLGSWSSLERHWRQNSFYPFYEPKNYEPKNYEPKNTSKNGNSTSEETKEYTNNGTTHSKNHLNSIQSSDSLSNGDHAFANTLSLDSKNCLIIGSKEGLIATLGVENLLIIKTPDVTLICHKEKEQEIKKLIQELQKKETLRNFL